MLGPINLRIQNIEYYAKARWHLFYARGTS
jgi:hypothetical protein